MLLEYKSVLVLFSICCSSVMVAKVLVDKVSLEFRTSLQLKIVKRLPTKYHKMQISMHCISMLLQNSDQMEIEVRLSRKEIQEIQQRTI